MPGVQIVPSICHASRHRKKKLQFFIYLRLRFLIFFCCIFFFFVVVVFVCLIDRSSRSSFEKKIRIDIKQNKIIFFAICALMIDFSWYRQGFSGGTTKHYGGESPLLYKESIVTTLNSFGMPFGDTDTVVNH